MVKIKEKSIEFNGAKYRYELTEFDSSNPECKEYGINIQMSLNGSITRASSGRIFYDLNTATLFFERLAKHLVTPLNLEYVIEDELNCKSY